MAPLWFNPLLALYLPETIMIWPILGAWKMFWKYTEIYWEPNYLWEFVGHNTPDGLDFQIRQDDWKQRKTKIQTVIIKCPT